MCEGARVASSHTRSGVTPPARPTTTRGTGPGKFFKDFFFLGFVSRFVWRWRNSLEPDRECWCLRPWLSGGLSRYKQSDVRSLLSIKHHVHTGRHRTRPYLETYHPILRSQFWSLWWPVSPPTPDPRLRDRDLCPYPGRAATAPRTTSSTLTSPPTRSSSGDTGGATPTTTGRSTSRRRTTPSKPR